MNRERGLLFLAIFMLVFLLSESVSSAPMPGIDIQVNPTDDPEGVVDSLRLLMILTVLALAPAILIVMTSFTRVIVVLSFVRNAMATQQTPPNQVLIGLALFLTFFIMAPVFGEINEVAIEPYLEGEISQEEALDNAADPMKEFMLAQTREQDLALFVDASGMETPISQDELPIHVLIPAFMISELKTAFQMGFLIYVPFLVIDMVVASTLMSMGMFMVPPIIISLPFKVLLFVMTDGWHLVVKSVLESYL